MNYESFKIIDKPSLSLFENFIHMLFRLFTLAI